jgi:archaellum component FlaF (FlaF/FlaG flagellin family)
LFIVFAPTKEKASKPNSNQTKANIMKTKITFATFVALISITVAQFVTAEVNADKGPEYIRTLAEQAKMAKEHNSPDDESAFMAASGIIEKKSGSLTDTQRKRLMESRATAHKFNQTAITDAIDLAMSLATTVTVAPTTQNTASETVCNRILRNGQKCPDTESAHVLVQGIKLCPHDTCKFCGKEIAEHSSSGFCPTTADHDENQLNTQLVQVTKKDSAASHVEVVVSTPPAPKPEARKSLKTAPQKVPAHLAPKP